MAELRVLIFGFKRIGRRLYCLIFYSLLSLSLARLVRESSFKGLQAFYYLDKVMLKLKFLDTVGKPFKEGADRKLTKVVQRTKVI